MLQVRKSNERGHANYGWLKTYYSFSFADYNDPKYMGFGVLRVINEDFIDAKQGFPTHGHRDMEIITYLIEGAIEHRDTLGNSVFMRPGEIQHMSAGSGIRHSEYNPDSIQVTHLLQIWILPNKLGYKPHYEQKSFSEELKSGELKLIASEKGRAGSLVIQQDVELYAAKAHSGKNLIFSIRNDRKIWVQLIKGSLTVNEKLIEPGDGLAIVDEKELSLNSDNAEFLLFDLPHV